MREDRLGNYYGNLGKRLSVASATEMTLEMEKNEGLEMK